MNTKLKKLSIVLIVLLMGITDMYAQNNNVRRELVSPAVDFFVPHWKVGIQAGAAYDVGEAKFADLISPALQLTAGYHFNEYLAARLGLSGLWARNRYAYPEAKYKWNFIQPAVDLQVDLTNLIGGWDLDRLFSVYAFAGVGAAFEFNNDDAQEADQRFGIDFQKLWKDNRWNPVVRGGLGADYQITENIAIGFEANANMLPDHFNSKRGKHNNRDWHFNALLGVKINLGPTHGRVEAQYRDIVEPAPVVEKPKQFQDDDAVALTEYVQFELNKSVIRSSQYQKIIRVAQYLNSHPDSHVELTGFADKLTGTPTINQRLSQERAAAVAQFLIDRGINRSRISKYAKGDRVQPFEVNEDNRVTICIVIEEGLKKEVE
jgi:outer membrane protein OmpA-like peptidoglycan-associated protein